MQKHSRGGRRLQTKLGRGSHLAGFMKHSYSTGFSDFFSHLFKLLHPPEQHFLEKVTMLPHILIKETG
jgi:hypothetical protein